MRIFKNKDFHKWALKQKISDPCLIKAVTEIETGLFEANLGSGIYKKRLPLGNKGKRGGARSIVAFKVSTKAFFIYGFGKSKIDNISLLETEALKKLAKIYFGYQDNDIKIALKHGELIEVVYEKINS